MSISEISAIKVAEIALGEYIARILVKSQQIDRKNWGKFEVCGTWITLNEDHIKVAAGNWVWNYDIQQTFLLADPDSFEKARSLATTLIDLNAEKVGSATHLQSFLITKDKGSHKQLRWKPIQVEIHSEKGIYKSDKKPFFDFRYQIWGVPRGKKASILRNGITRPFYVLEDYSYDKLAIEKLEEKLAKKDDGRLYQKSPRWKF